MQKKWPHYSKITTAFSPSTENKRNWDVGKYLGSILQEDESSKLESDKRRTIGMLNASLWSSILAKTKKLV